MASAKEALTPETKERYAKVERIFEIPILLACLMVLPTIVLHESSKGGADYNLGYVFNWISWAIFVAEFVALLIFVPERRVWLKRSPIEIFIVFVTAPILLPYEFGVLRLLALFRLLRLAKYGRKAFTTSGLKYASLLTLLTVFVGGAIFSTLQKPNVSTWEGIWWAVQTITTVGYGDIVPDTTGGKLLAITVMFVGMGFVALLTAFVAERFIQPDIGSEQEESAMHPHIQEVLDRLDSISARLDRIENNSESRPT